MSDNNTQSSFRIEVGERRFGRVNWLGLKTLAGREIKRFLVVYTQTLLAPLVTAGLQSGRQCASLASPAPGRRSQEPSPTRPATTPQRCRPALCPRRRTWCRGTP